MFVDANKIAEKIVAADLCIIGGGAAGITLANKFVDSKLKIVLLESGGDSMDRETEKLNTNATVTGDPYTIESSRLRFFGGTTNHWSGRCFLFRDHDFLSVGGPKVVGWPISLKDVAPYYQQAQRIAMFQTQDVNWSPDYWRKRFGSPAWPIDEAIFPVRTEIFARPHADTGNRTYAAYRRPLDSAKNIRVIQYANATELIEGPDRTKIEEVVVKTLAGAEFRVRARIFILATGGLENPRLMLASRRSSPRGVGNNHDQVGRYFADHARILQDFVRNPDREPDDRVVFTEAPGDIFVFNHYLLSDHILDSERLDSILFRFRPVYESTPGTAAAGRLTDALGARALSQVSADDLALAMQNFGDVAERGVDRYYCRSKPIRYLLSATVDPPPVAESRVTLTPELDALGMPILNLHWVLPDTAKHSLHRALQLFAQEAGRTNTGRVRLTFDPKKPWSEAQGFVCGNHHTGTTRMSDDPKTGVVDRNCRVHGMSNLYVAGSSVFPTVGGGSTTMMITALALRLADHIDGQFA